MSNYPHEVQSIIDHGYSFQFGSYISRGFQIVNKELGLFIGYTITFLLISIVLAFIPLIGSVLSTFFINPALAAGFYLASRRIDDQEGLVFSDFFKGFDWWQNLAVVILIQLGVYMIVLVPAGLFAYLSIDLSSNIPDITTFPFWIFLFMLPIIYISVAWVFAPMLVVFYDMKGWDALEASRKIVTQNWFSYLLFGFVVGIIVMLGMLLFGIGMLYTLPAGACMLYAAFRGIVGMPDSADEPQFSTHLVD